MLAYGFSEFFLYLQFKCFHRVQLILPQNQLLPTMCNINMPQPKISIPLQISRSVCLVRSADLSSQLKLLLLAYRQCYRQDSVLSFSFPFDTKPSISLFPSEVESQVIFSLSHCRTLSSQEREKMKTNDTVTSGRKCEMIGDFQAIPSWDSSS